MPPLHVLLSPTRSKGCLYTPSHTQDNTYLGLCYTSCGSLAGYIYEDIYEEQNYTHICIILLVYFYAAISIVISSHKADRQKLQESFNIKGKVETYFIVHVYHLLGPFLHMNNFDDNYGQTLLQNTTSSCSLYSDPQCVISIIL